MQQPGLFDAPQRLFPCTPSRLAAFEDCPRRYRYTYIDRPSPQKGPPWAHNSLGSSVHNALRNLYGLEPGRRQVGALPTLLKAAWVRDGYRDVEQERAAFRRALGWLETYVGGLDPADEPIGVERTVAARTATLALSGRVDRIDLRGDELVIVDYKTGRAGLSVDDARGSLALALYAFAAQRTLRRRCTRVELHHLPTGTVVAHEHTEQSLDRHLRRAEATARDAVAAAETMAAGAAPDEAFPSRTGALCGWCDYRRVCAEGAAVSPAKEPWSAMES